MEMDSSTDSETYMEDDDYQLFTSFPWLMPHLSQPHTMGAELSPRLADHGS